MTAHCVNLYSLPCNTCYLYGVQNKELLFFSIKTDIRCAIISILVLVGIKF